MHDSIKWNSDSELLLHVNYYFTNDILYESTLEHRTYVLFDK